MSKTLPRLGRGLSALIPQREVLSGASVPGDLREADGPRDVALAAIRPNPRQPRRTFNETAMRALADSIRSAGILQPVLVRPVGDGQYELLAGERRWRAAKLAGLEIIQVLVREASDARAIEMALIENLQREDLQPLERAAAYKQYLEEFGIGAEELARRLGESRANIANYVRLLSLSPEIRDLVESGGLAMGQARAIAGIEDAQRQLAVAKLAARRNLAVRQVEALAKSGNVSRETAGGENTAARRHLVDVEESLSRAMGLKVGIVPGRRRNSGRIVIRYENLEDFDRIAERIGGKASLE
jgi:ParB family chromosome partitioning protein